MIAKNKLLLSKLLDVVANQQKIIHKLAQAQIDPNVEYLKRAVDVAATNAGIQTPIGVYVANQLANSENTLTETGYIATISGMEHANNALKEKFLTVFKNQVKNQKPELDGKITILFQ